MLQYWQNNLKGNTPNHLIRQHRIRYVLFLVAGRGKPFRIRNISTPKHHRRLTAPKILSLSFMKKMHKPSVNTHDDKCLAKKFQNTGTGIGNSAKIYS